MENAPITVSSSTLTEELARLLGDADPASVVMAFDGDGTLWSGDVGEDLLRAALREEFLLEDAQPALLEEAKQYRIALPEAASANTIAQTLVSAYLGGQYPERETCAMMVWCYAGRALAEVERLASSVLREEGLEGRLQRELSPILQWARQRGVRCVLISASPRAIVEPAAALWGFSPGDIAAATPALKDAYILPKLAGPVPYAEAKLTAGRELFGEARWLAAFGDNVFDLDMLTTAERGIAVRPKPKLATKLHALGLRVLASPPQPGPPGHSAR